MENVVLLVDDDQNILHGLARALRQQPYRLYTATSAEEALRVLKAHDVDVIVTDEHMPGMCGSDLLVWVAENYPEVTRIVLTGCATVETAIRAINEGAVCQFFTKPCNPAVLGIAIRKALERTALVTENRRLLDANRRQEREIERYKREMHDLAGLVSHGIPETLTRVSLARQALEERCQGVADPGARALVGDAVDGVAEVSRLVNDLLEHCRAGQCRR